MDYIKYIRSMVSHNAINLTGVNVIIYNDKHEVLLQKRGEYPANIWGLLGGITELGESLEETAIREVKEETNLDISNITLLGTTSGKGAYMDFPNGDKAYFITIGYYTNEYSGEMIVDNEETLDLEFFAHRDIPDNVPRTHKEMIDRFYEVMAK